jgi:hypothetical protein
MTNAQAPREKLGETLGTEHFISPRSSGQRVVVNQSSEREDAEEVPGRTSQQMPKRVDTAAETES